MGGDRFLLFQFEYITRITDPFDLVLFFDAGQSYGEVPGFDISDLRYSVGLEARFHLPVFQAPLRLIWGKVLDEQPGDRLNSFQFSIGFPF